MTRRTPRHTLFPYTTLFRSRERTARHGARPRRREDAPRHDPLELLRAVARGGGARSHAGLLRTPRAAPDARERGERDRKSTRLNSSHLGISYAVFCLKKKKK